MFQAQDGLYLQNHCGATVLQKYRFYSTDARRSKLHIACSDFFKSQSALPPRAPRRSKLHIACSDFFQKSERAHCAAPPFQIEPASLGFDLVLGAISKENRFDPLRAYPKIKASEV